MFIFWFCSHVSLLTDGRRRALLVQLSIFEGQKGGTWVVYCRRLNFIEIHLSNAGMLRLGNL